MVFFLSFLFFSSWTFIEVWNRFKELIAPIGSSFETVVAFTLFCSVTMFLCAILLRIALFNGMRKMSGNRQSCCKDIRHFISKLYALNYGDIGKQCFRLQTLPQMRKCLKKSISFESENWFRKVTKSVQNSTSQMRKCLKQNNMFWIRKLIQKSNQIWLKNDFRNQHP